MRYCSTSMVSSTKSKRSSDTRSSESSSRDEGLWYSVVCKCYKRDLIPVLLAVLCCLTCLLVCLVTYFVVEQAEKVQLQVALNSTCDDVVSRKVQLNLLTSRTASCNGQCTCFIGLYSWFLSRIIP